MARTVDSDGEVVQLVGESRQVPPRMRMRARTIVVVKAVAWPLLALFAFFVAAGGVAETAQPGVLRGLIGLHRPWPPVGPHDLSREGMVDVVECGLDVGQAVYRLSAAATNIRAAKYKCEVTETEDQKAACSAAVSGILFNFIYVATTLSQAVTDCAHRVNAPAVCSSVVTGMIANLATIAGTGSDVQNSCSPPPLPTVTPFQTAPTTTSYTTPPPVTTTATPPPVTTTATPPPVTTTATPPPATTSSETTTSTYARRRRTKTRTTTATTPTTSATTLPVTTATLPPSPAYTPPPAPTTWDTTVPATTATLPPTPPPAVTTWGPTVPATTATLPPTPPPAVTTWDTTQPATTATWAPTPPPAVTTWDTTQPATTAAWAPTPAYVTTASAAPTPAYAPAKPRLLAPKQATMVIEETVVAGGGAPPPPPRTIAIGKGKEALKTLPGSNATAFSMIPKEWIALGALEDKKAIEHGNYQAAIVDCWVNVGQGAANLARASIGITEAVRTCESAESHPRSGTRAKRCAVNIVGLLGGLGWAASFLAAAVPTCGVGSGPGMQHTLREAQCASDIAGIAAAVFAATAPAMQLEDQCKTLVAQMGGR